MWLQLWEGDCVWLLLFLLCYLFIYCACVYYAQMENRMQIPQRAAIASAWNLIKHEERQNQFIRHTFKGSYLPPPQNNWSKLDFSCCSEEKVTFEKLPSNNADLFLKTITFRPMKKLARLRQTLYLDKINNTKHAIWFFFFFLSSFTLAVQIPDAAYCIKSIALHLRMHFLFKCPQNTLITSG